MKRIAFALLAAMFAPSLALGQFFTSGGAGTQMYLQDATTGVVRERGAARVEGSPYWAGDYGDATIHFRDGDYFLGQARYDGVHDLLEVPFEGEPFNLKSSLVSSAELTDPQTGQKCVFMNGFGRFEGVEDFHFFIVHHQSEQYVLLERYRKIFSEQFANGYNTTEKVHRYVTDSRLLLGRGDQLEEVVLRKRRILELFPESAAAIEDMVKERGLSYDEVSTVVAILLFMESRNP